MPLALRRSTSSEVDLKGLGGLGLGEGGNGSLGQNGWLKRDAAHGCNRGLSSISGSMQGEGGSCQPSFTDQK